MRIVPNTYNSYNYQLNLQNTNRRQTSNFLQMVGPNATDQVKESWKKAEQEVGANGFALASDGKFTQLTELMGMSLVKYHQTGKAFLVPHCRFHDSSCLFISYQNGQCRFIQI